MNNKKITDIKQLKVLKRFTDDSLPAAKVSYTQQDGEVEEIEILWHDDLGFLTYWEESALAKVHLIDALNNAKYCALLTLLEDTPEIDEEGYAVGKAALDKEFGYETINHFA